MKTSKHTKLGFVPIQIFLFLVTITALLCKHTAEGKRYCYICNTWAHGVDCLDNPDNVTTPENPSPCRDFCTIKRQGFINIPGQWVVVYFERNCVERPYMLDGVEAENNHMSYYRSCKANLCNGGDGLTSLKDIPEEPYVEEENEGFSIHQNYRSNTIRIFKIYFFAFVASTFSIT